ncbi:MAG: magnesium/cobalt efflux protein [Gammaproteobacteria bacterium]|nr:MAG: magnesium/cobalt efflux protein [Gammaproteobacteria bacterium]
MDEIPLSVLGGLLFLLILCSAFFSSSETGMMSMNRYRLRHMVQSGNSKAKRVQNLLDRPDRLIGVILIGNNFVNILASSIATVIAIRLWGDAGIAYATGLLTLIILIFAEVTPKTLAALKPDTIAFPASLILRPLLYVLYPAVWLINSISNFLLSLGGIRSTDISSDELSQEELRTVVNESGALIPRRHKSMLLSILDLESVSVDDIMVPKHEVLGIDLDQDIESIINTLRSSQHTRMPVYKSDLNNPVGLLHLRKVTRLLTEPEPTKAALMQQAVEPYYVPEGTPLHTQLINFQRVKRRLGFVVDEYGDVQGIVTLEDILEEIVGEFTTDAAASNKDIHPREDGSYIIDGAAAIRDINKTLKWDLPTDGPKTLSGLITETLETIPETHLCIKLNDYCIEIVEIKDNLIKNALIHKQQ